MSPCSGEPPPLPFRATEKGPLGWAGGGTGIPQSGEGDPRQAESLQPGGREPGHPGGEPVKALPPGVLRRGRAGERAGGNGETPSLEAAGSSLLRDSLISSWPGQRGGALPGGASGAVSLVPGERAAGPGGGREGGREGRRRSLEGERGSAWERSCLASRKKKEKETAGQRGNVWRGGGLLALPLREIKII